MRSRNILVVGSDDLGKRFGKKESSGDVDYYNLKRGSFALTFLRPSRFPERIVPLAFAASSSERAVIEVTEIGPAFGETLLLLDAVGLENGAFILGNGMWEDGVRPVLKGSVSEGWEFVDPDVYREALLEWVAAEKDEAGEGCRVVVDRCFKVKGVGTVALGWVQEGVVERHQKLILNPSGKRVEVRSIQVHDNEEEAAPRGCRVGLALRGVEPEDVERGDQLSSQPLGGVKGEIPLIVKKNRFFKTPLSPGMVLHLVCLMASSPFRIMKVEGETVSGIVEKEMVVKEEDPVVALHLDSKGNRVVGRACMKSPEKR